MPVSNHCFIPILGKRLRITALDSVGNPPAGGSANAWLATSGFITATLTSDIEAGAEIIGKKADGSLCVSEKLSSSFKRFNLDLEFCGVNPFLLSMVTNVSTYLDYALDYAGFHVPEGTINKKFALELWTGLSGAQPAGVQETGGYLLLPFVQAGTIGDIAVTGDKEVTFSMKGAYTRGQNMWGVGPYQVVKNASAAASALPTALDPMDHMLLMDTSLAQPPDACDPQIMPPVPAVGAVAGFPGYFTPVGATPPANFTAANTALITASPATNWLTGQYVQGSTAGVAGQMNWTGTTWATGAHA